MTEIRKGDWLQTFTGLRFWPLDPRPDEILIHDIAHALSMQCRFAGHVKRFYSVAEHSVHVSYACAPEDALWGLLHDASEAYLVDVARPVKRLPSMTEYRTAEANLQRAIARRFGLPDDEPESVQVADKLLLAVEARDLLSPLQPGWEKWLDRLGSFDLRITRPWPPEEAEERFTARFYELTADKEPALSPIDTDDLMSIRRAASILGRKGASARLARRAPVSETLTTPLFGARPE